VYRSCALISYPLGFGGGGGKSPRTEARQVQGDQKNQKLYYFFQIKIKTKNHLQSSETPMIGTTSAFQIIVWTVWSQVFCFSALSCPILSCFTLDRVSPLLSSPPLSDPPSYGVPYPGLTLVNLCRCLPKILLTGRAERTRVDVRHPALPP
jgi:hypothetical protein